MANRYADDIRRIVGKDDRGNPLGDAKDREKVLGSRGIAYYSAGGQGNVSQQSGFNGSGTAGIPGSSADNPQGDSSTDTTGSNGNATGGTSENREKPFDPSDPFSLISKYLGFDEDGNTEQRKTDINEAMTDWSYNSPDALKVLSGIDPDTGQDVEIYLGALSYPPPDGWDDPNVPPSTGPDPTWQQGYYWEHNYANVNGKFATPTEAHDAFVAQHTTDQAAFGNAYEYDPVSQVAPDTYQSCFRQVQSGGMPIPPGPTACIEIPRFACTGGDPSGPGDYCSLEPPTVGDPEFWPPIDKIILDLDNAIANVNEYQNPNDLTGFTQGGNSRINLESAENPGTYYGIEPTGTGGTLIYETSTPNGEPVGVYKTFDALGRFTGYGDASTIDYVRPDSK